MPRFRGMRRRFCHIAAGSGFGLGNAAVALRLMPAKGFEKRLSSWIARHSVPSVASGRGVVGAHLLQPAPPPPMIREQSLRGHVKPMPWLGIAIAYDAAPLDRTAVEHLDPEVFRENGKAETVTLGRYAIDYTARAEEVARTLRPGPDVRDASG